MSPLLATSELVSIRLEEVRDWTPVLAPEKCEDPKKTLEATLQGSVDAGLEPLHRLYSSILKSPIVHDNITRYQQMIRVFPTAAPYRSIHLGQRARNRPGD